MSLILLLIAAGFLLLAYAVARVPLHLELQWEAGQAMVVEARHPVLRLAGTPGGRVQGDLLGLPIRWTQKARPVEPRAADSPPQTKSGGGLPDLALMENLLGPIADFLVWLPRSVLIGGCVDLEIGAKHPDWTGIAMGGAYALTAVVRPWIDVRVHPRWKEIHLHTRAVLHADIRLLRLLWTVLRLLPDVLLAGWRATKSPQEASKG